MGTSLEMVRGIGGHAPWANELLLSVFKDIDPRAEERGGKPLRVTLGERLVDAAAQLDGTAINDEEMAVSMRVRLAQTLSSLGETAASVETAEKAAISMEDLLGATHRKTLWSRHVLAGAYQDAGRTADGRPDAQDPGPVRRKGGEPDRAGGVGRLAGR